MAADMYYRTFMWFYIGDNLCIHVWFYKWDTRCLCGVMVLQM